MLFLQLTTSLTEKEQAAYAKAGSIAEEVFSCIRTVISFNGWHREKERYVCCSFIISDVFFSTGAKTVYPCSMRLH